MDSVDDCYTYLDHKSRRDPGGIACAAAALRALSGFEADLCDRRDDRGANAHATRSHFDAVKGCI